MGHIRLGELPRTGYWRDVINTLDLTNDPATIASKTLKAAHKGIDFAKHDIGVANVIYLFMKTVWASKAKYFDKALQAIGIHVSQQAGLVDIVGEFDRTTDKILRRSPHRSDLAEMARYSAVDTLNEICLQQTADLFGADIINTQQSLKPYTQAKKFGQIGKRFFGKFLYRFLDYHLSRELADHIGAGKQYRTLQDCGKFKAAMEKHCNEIALIIRDFSGGWPSVTEFRGGINAENVRTRFVPTAFNKIWSELERR